MPGFRLLVFSTVLMMTVMTSVSCQNKRTQIDWEQLKSIYSKNPADSLRLEALLFLKKNMKGMTSEIVGLKNPMTDSILYLKDIYHKNYPQDTLKKLIDVKGYLEIRSTLLDEEFISTEYIKQTIDDSFKAWESSVWKKDIPKDVFFNFLLPYKIYGEYPSNWRFELSKSMEEDYAIWKDTVKLEYAKNNIGYMNSIVSGFIIPQNRKWYKYNEQSVRIGAVPSFEEIVMIKNGDCHFEAAINSYLLKAKGIPAGFDVIPYWGSVNGSHATASYWNPAEKRMRPSDELAYRPAKVFRRTFKNQKNWSNQIRPVIKEARFDLAFLKNDHLLDVTEEYAKTTDVVVEVPKTHSLPFAYISVMDNEFWKPVFWSKVIDGKANFQNMGREVIYRLELPSKEGLYTYGSPFLLTLSGKMIYPSVLGRNVNLSLSAINSGFKAFVKAGKIYRLHYMNGGGDFTLLDTKTCLKDSVINFDKVPEATFYKLTDFSDHNRLSRVFSIKNGKQVWY